MGFGRTYQNNHKPDKALKLLRLYYTHASNRANVITRKRCNSPQGNTAMTTRRATDNTAALDAFIAAKADIDAMLARLAQKNPPTPPNPPAWWKMTARITPWAVQTAPQPRPPPPNPRLCPGCVAPQRGTVAPDHRCMVQRGRARRVRRRQKRLEPCPAIAGLASVEVCASRALQSWSYRWPTKNYCTNWHQS